MAIHSNPPARVLDPDGTIDRDLDPNLTAEGVTELYRLQVLARLFDEKAVSLHRQGRIGTYALLRGQEAAQVGAAAALADDDYLFPTYRDHAMYLTRGIPLHEVLLYLTGTGNYVDRLDRDDLTTFPTTIPIGTQLPHAVGVGMAAQYKDDDRAVLVSFGDGATSEGDFHEGMNFAGVFETPTVFFCQNNGYAISVPTERQTASATIAQKADAYGFDGVRVDGNDALAVYKTVRDALDRARAGDGPTLVEAVTYRQGAHTTTDDPSKYRDEDDVEAWRTKDPLDRMRTYLETEHDWTDEDEEKIRADATERIQDAIETAESHTGLDIEDMFAHAYADNPAFLAAQRDEVVDDPQVDH